MMRQISDDVFVDALRFSIRNQIENIISEEAEEAANRVRSRVADAGPTMATRLLSHFDMVKDERRIVIEIRKIIDDVGEKQE